MRSPILTLLLACLAPAQGYFVSPAAYATHEPGNSNTFPFASAQFRYQQIHGDVRGGARVLQGLGWRRDGLAASNTAFVARTLDAELFLADASYAGVKSTFASNYLGAPVNVFLRKSLSLPDHVPQPEGLPAPWDSNVLFDAPFLYSGGNDLVWDLVGWANTATSSWTCDAAASDDAQVTGGFTVAGTGCTTANGVMKLRTSLVADATSGMLSLQWSIARGPASAIAAVLVGATDPSVALPGLCNNELVHTDAGYFVVNGTTSAVGSFATPKISVAHKSAYVNLALTSQAAALDPSQPLGIAVSNGNAALAPPLPTSPLQIARVLASTSATAASGALGVGFGIVTRFRY